MALIATSNVFETLVLICIIVNTIVFTLQWWRQPDTLQSISKILNYFFLGVFAVEAIIKLIAFGQTYFNESWNIFDFVVVLATFVGLILE